MRSTTLRLIVATTVAWFAGASVSGAQSSSLRDHVRKYGSATITLTACGPVAGLREIVRHTQLTVEGTITLAESRLTTEEDNVYTDYEIDVSRVFRAPSSATRSIPGPTIQPSPFVIDAPLTRPGATTKLRVRLRRSYHGTVMIDGGVVTATSQPAFPTLTLGQHVMVSAYFDETRGWWVPFGVFEVRDGRVLRLDADLQTKDYDSVEEFAAAVANPPPTRFPE